jgi:Spy/CpxP family protein refolding chaperone
MFPLKRRLTATAITLTANLTASPAGAQASGADAQAYPCGSGKKLTVVQDGPGFSIRHAGGPIRTATATPITGDSLVAIGNALRVDRTIFAITPQHSEDETHAPRR